MDNILSVISSPVFWLGFLVVMIVIEVLTLGLTTIWFAGGALVALILSLLQVNIIIQLICFLVVSFVLLYFTRPYAIKHLNRKTTQTNVGEMIGETAVVTIEIDNLVGKGEISVHGRIWTARSEDEKVKIPVDSVVKVIRIEGVKAIVQKNDTKR